MIKPLFKALAIFLLLFFAACGEKETVIEVQSVAISQPSAEMVIGETLTLKATVSPSNASFDGITWTSTNPKIASVSTSGLVTALSTGNTTITVMAGGKTASCAITVVKGYVAVTSISLNKTSIEMIEGDSETLIASVFPDDATNKTVTWTSSEDRVVTVYDGLITAISAGEATIVAKAGDKTASCIVTVQKKVIAVESVELNKTDLTLFVGETATLTAIVKPDDATDKSVTWDSSDEAVVDISPYGEVFAKGVGQATISVTTVDGEKKAFCNVIVNEDLPSFSVPEAVDLGLSVCWASFNVGATKPEERGNYYAWGEVETKSDYLYDNYKWSDGSLYSMSKYNQDDNITVLDLGDDAAYVNLGPLWRMPTYEETLEIRLNCDVEESSVNGINGRKITSKINGNSFFLPDRCWTSSLISEYQAYAFGGNSWGSAPRYSGLPVRPVFGELSLSPAFSEIQSEARDITFSVDSKLDFRVISESDWIQVKNISNTSVTISVNKNTTGKLREGKVQISLANGAVVRNFYVFQAKEYTFEPEAVDLGLSVKWSSMNLGASSPEDYGAYYTWGDIDPIVFLCEENSYKWHIPNFSAWIITKYNTKESFGNIDNKVVLDSEDDAAYIKLEGKWRMPTSEECIELIENCEWRIESRNGTNGIVFTSKINGNAVFFPFPGAFLSNKYYGIEESGSYWSANLDTNWPPFASALNLSSDSDPYGSSSLPRYMACPIRPVTE